MTERVLISGFGGQGIMFLGRLLAWLAMYKDKQVTFLPAYGAEVRGGTAHCSLIISDTEIFSPCIDKIDTLIALNRPSLEKFIPQLRKGGRVLVNASMVERRPEIEDARVYFIPFSDLASGLGDIKTANMIALGVYLTTQKVLSQADIVKILPQAFKSKPELVALNKKALEIGIEAVRCGSHKKNQK